LLVYQTERGDKNGKCREKEEKEDEKT